MEVGGSSIQSGMTLAIIVIIITTTTTTTTIATAIFIIMGLASIDVFLTCVT